MPRRKIRIALLVLPLVASLGCSLGQAVATLGVEATALPRRQTVVVEREVEAEAPAEEPAGEYRAPTASPAPTLAPPNDEALDDMFFEDYGVNPFVDTEDDRLSTFALDVDSGAYTVMRNYVNRGELPPDEAVRVEEFVNYFDQGYEYPPEGQAFAIHVDGAPFPFAETERYQILRIGIQGYAVAPEDRKDVSLTFVIDVSGSMDVENRLGLVKRSLELLVEQLRPTDSVGIVVYGSNARVVLEPTSGDEKGAILDAIYSLHSEGATNAEEGLLKGYQMALRAFNPDGINRVILCSDGVANVGSTGANSILERIKGYVSEGVTLTTVGFGMGNYNDVLMEQLANNGDGFYAYVDSLREAEKLFVENLTSTLQAIAKDAKVQVEFNPEVVARYRLIGFENRAIADEEFRDDTVDAGEIGAGHSVTALYEVKLHPDASGPVATVYLRWEDPDTHEVTELSHGFGSEDVAGSLGGAHPRFQMAVVVSEYAEILRDSYWAQDSTLASVLEEAERVGGLLPEDADVAEFVGLVRQAKAISGSE